MASKKPKSAPPRPQVRGKVTPELYEEILLWYVQNGNQHVKAAKHFNLSRRTLTGLYFSGSPGLNKPPMRLMLDDVNVRARALREQLKKEELARADAEIQSIIQGTADQGTLGRALDDAMRARAEEGAVVSAGRRNILKLQSMLAPLLTGAVTRMKELEKDIQKLAPEDLIKMMKDLAKLQGDLITAAKNNMDMERLLLGDPNAGKDNAPSQLNQKEALKVLDLAARTMQRMRDEGRLIDGHGEQVAAVVDGFDDEDDSDEGSDAMELEPSSVPS